MSAIARMIDANANRAREALRVMEDVARFVLDDGDLCADLKSLRHDLQAALNSLPDGWLIANRDTPGDVGTTISTESEASRGVVGDIAIAAGKRLSEALRVIEEAAKTIDPEIALGIESIRYRAYDLEQRLTLSLGSGRARQWKLCLLLTQSMCLRPWREVLAGAIEGGVDCMQVREKEMDGGDLAAHVREVMAIVRGATASERSESAVRAGDDLRAHGRTAAPPGRGTHIPVIVNDRADVALATGANGVHLGQSDLSVHDVRRLTGRTLMVGVSTHDLIEAERAVNDGADYCGVGAMFPSATKQRATSGLAYLRQFIARFPNTPHLAIGGITTENAADVYAAGANGVAVSAAICGADDPANATREMVAAIDSAKRQALPTA